MVCQYCQCEAASQIRQGHPTHRNMQFLIKNIPSFFPSSFLSEHQDLNFLERPSKLTISLSAPMFLKNLASIQIWPGLAGRISAVLLQNICKNKAAAVQNIGTPAVRHPPSCHCWMQPCKCWAAGLDCLCEVEAVGVELLQCCDTLTNQTTPLAGPPRTAAKATTDCSSARELQ